MAYKTEFIITPEGRFAHQFLDVPRDKDVNGKPLEEPRYETVIYFPKTHPDPQQCRTYQMLAAKVMEVVTQVFKGQWPKRNWEDWPIVDCDADAAGLEKAPHGRGCWRIRASGGRYPVEVVDQGNNKLSRDIGGRFREFKGGDWGIASVNCYSYDNTFGKGASFGLEAVKKTRDGDPIGGGQRPVEQIFGPATGAPVGSNAGPPSLSGPGPQAAMAYGGPQAPGVYGGAPPVAPPPPPAPPPVDPTASWQHDPSGQWMLNPQTNQWMMATAAAPPPPPTGSPGYAQAMAGPGYGPPTGGMPPPPPLGTR